jgi:hypothetical protein
LLAIRNLKLSLFINESLIEEELTKKIIDAAIEVHRYWGPGLIESIYEKSLAVELEKRAIPFKRQLKLKRLVL